MIRQYYAHRCQGGANPLRVGVVPAGAIFYIQEDFWWRDRFRGRPTCREPWIVESFLNGEIAAARRDPDAGFWVNVYAARRSDMAVMRSLRSGRRQQIAVRTLILHEDEGLWRDGGGYPELPTLPYCRQMPSGRLMSRAA
jgi:hypothetical protein